MNVLRRLPLSRLVLLCGLVVAIGVSATALASAVGGGPVPPPKPLAQAVHDALGGGRVDGFSARVKLTNHLVEGAELAGGDGAGGGLVGSPLLTGASGRIWVSNDGRLRLELQSEKGDTQILYDGHTLRVYDASTNTLYRYTPPAEQNTGSQQPDHHEAPSVAKIEEVTSHLREHHVNVSGATPDNVAGRPAYTVRVSPAEGGSEIGGAELSWDAQNGVPLRVAVYSAKQSTPVIELAANEISYGPVEASVFDFTPPPDAKVQDIAAATKEGSKPGADTGSSEHPKLTTHGRGPGTVAVLENKAQEGDKQSGAAEGLPKVRINGVDASELATPLGTLLSFERSGVRYVVGGFVPPGKVEEVARGL